MIALRDHKCKQTSVYFGKPSHSLTMEGCEETGPNEKISHSFISKRLQAAADVGGIPSIMR